MSILVVFVLVVALIASAFFVIGPKTVWTAIAGPPDQGALDFTKLKRSTRPHDALLCTPPLCDGLTVDGQLPTYSGKPHDVLDKLQQSALSDTPLINRVDDGANPLARRYVVHTPIMRFPDTIWVEAQEMNDRTGLRLYARAQIGHSDLGNNLKRLKRWTDALGQQ